MALETLRNVKELEGSKVINMTTFKQEHPEFFREDGSMHYEKFEKEIRPFYPIQVREDVNSISFTVQKGPINESGANGCQVTAMIAAAKAIIEEFQKTHPCRENAVTITKLDEALMWQERRTKERLKRGVEGTSKQ